ncbi:hypothetical protein HYFRA_00011697 [Hymenoscyphus fraxineus]|uniref:Uncharacterized protein n=1 Tax=Hymenoscyphus fraxineus TaxID=746836 RepID=A0A9N9L0A0_9HELO|nr:hypothetical protein HYFRA_00011697 [Hymenoscyphus fraxineus]
MASMDTLSALHPARCTLSFIDPSPWDEIYGDRKTGRKGHAILPKDPQFYNKMLLDEKTVAMATDDDAVPIRKAMNPAFSHKALLDQEPMIKSHLKRFMKQSTSASYHDRGSQSRSVDFRLWLTFSMFDINSDFVFVENMGCVASGVLEIPRHYTTLDFMIHNRFVRQQ